MRGQAKGTYNNIYEVYIPHIYVYSFKYIYICN